MGAWGTGPFDNDDALDFFLDIEDAPADRIASRLRRALDNAADEEAYLAERVAGEAIAAATMVAYWQSVADGVTGSSQPGTGSSAAGAAGSSGAVSSAARAAAIVGNPRVDEWLAAHRAALVAADTDLALRALDRVSGARSEWTELWADAGHAEEVQAMVRAIHESLERAVPGSPNTAGGGDRAAEGARCPI